MTWSRGGEEPGKHKAEEAKSRCRTEMRQRRNFEARNRKQRGEESSCAGNQNSGTDRGTEEHKNQLRKTKVVQSDGRTEIEEVQAEQKSGERR